MIRINCYLTQLELDTLKRKSVHTGLSVAELIRRAIDKLIEFEDTQNANENKNSI